MEKFNDKVLHFVTALIDVYKNEEEKESTGLIPLELKNEELTEDFTAMIYAMWAIYVNITKESVDVIGFTHIINRLVFQKFMEDRDWEANHG